MEIERQKHPMDITLPSFDMGPLMNQINEFMI